MEKQLIIALGREFGSGGHEIGKRLAKKLGINFYDRKMLDELANEMGILKDDLKKYDERPRNIFKSTRRGIFSNSLEEIVAELQFDYIRNKADSGESFVIVGRCAESVLAGREGLISVFVTGDEENKMKAVMEAFELSETAALDKMRRHDKSRKRYHNEHSRAIWGDSRFYDVCINSRIGLDNVVDVLELYVKKATEK